MPRKRINFDRAREIGLALPDVEAGTAYGSPALKVRGEMFVCKAIHRSAAPNTMVALVGFKRRDELITADPTVFYLTNHYVNYPTVLVRLSRIEDDDLRQVLRMAKRFVKAHKGPIRPRRRPATGVRRLAR
jgi:hypothetical protein